MRITFAHNVYNAFFLWLDNWMLTHADAYSTKTTKFYNYSDSRLGGGKVVYGSPFKQWVYDKSITGITYPTGLTINGSFVPTGVSGLAFDFENGRALFDSGVSTSLDITGTYSVRDINLYTSNQTEESLIIENKYINNSRFYVTGSYIPPYSQVTPCMFISTSLMSNEPFALGGEDETTLRINSVILADSMFLLDGTLSTLNDAFNCSFSNVPMTGHPIGEFGQIKTGSYPTGYYYNNVKSINSGSISFITEVDISKMRDDVARELNTNLFIGFADFVVKNYRNSRA
jgi:hypothetical protein